MTETINNFMRRSQNCGEKSSELEGLSGFNDGAEPSSVIGSGGEHRKGKEIIYGGSEVEWLNDRLRNLEVEAEEMKLAIMESMEERNKLMNEINQQFWVIRNHLPHREQVDGEASGDGVLIVNPFKNGRAGTGGLPQLLHQQYNPSLVIRDLRATMPAFEERSEVYEF